MILTTPNTLPLEFTQGDTALLELVATDDQGNPFDLTGAVFTTEILGPNVSGPVLFPNSQHAIVDAPNGKFALALSAGDTTNCGLGQNKQIITMVSQSGIVSTFRGTNILTVYSPNPSQ